MGRSTFSERQRARYRIRVIVGILIAIWATVILGVGLYVKCCTYREDNWLTNLQTPIWTGGILLTTGLLFLCSNFRPRKSSGQMLDIIVVLVLILTVLSETVFIYNFLSFHGESLKEDMRQDMISKTNFVGNRNLGIADSKYLKTWKKYHLNKNEFLKTADYLKIWLIYKKLYEMNHSKNNTQSLHFQKSHDNKDDDDDDDDDDGVTTKIELTRNLYLSLIVMTGIEVILLSSILLKWGHKEKLRKVEKKKDDHGPLINRNIKDSNPKDNYKTFPQTGVHSPSNQPSIRGYQGNNPPQYDDIYSRVTESSFI